MISERYFMCTGVEMDSGGDIYIKLAFFFFFFRCMSDHFMLLNVWKYSSRVHWCCLWCCFNLQPLQRAPFIPAAVVVSCFLSCSCSSFSSPLSLSAASHSWITLFIMCCCFVLSAAICRTQVTPRRLSSSQRRPLLRASAALLLWQEQRPRRYNTHTHTHTQTHTSSAIVFICDHPPTLAQKWVKFLRKSITYFGILMVKLSDIFLREKPN